MSTVLENPEEELIMPSTVLGEGSKINIDDFDAKPSETADDVLKSPQYTPVDRMSWWTPEKQHHPDNRVYEEGAECETQETLLAEGLNLKVLSATEEYDMISRYHSTTDPVEKAIIRDEFLSRNLRLAQSEASKIARKSDYSAAELMSWAFMGLEKAFDKFDLTLGNKFATYAGWWIRESITRGIAETGRPMRLPYNVFCDFNKLKRFEKTFQQTTGADPEDEDIIAHFGWTQNRLDNAKRGYDTMSSLDLPATSDGEDTIATLIEDTDALPVDEEAMANLLGETVHSVVDDTLDERAKDVIANLYGFRGSSYLDKKGLAKKYGVSVERISQIHDEAISMLRHPAKAGKLRAFLSTTKKTSKKTSKK